MEIYCVCVRVELSSISYVNICQRVDTKQIEQRYQASVCLGSKTSYAPDLPASPGNYTGASVTGIGSNMLYTYIYTQRIHTCSNTSTYTCICTYIVAAEYNMADTQYGTMVS